MIKLSQSPGEPNVPKFFSKSLFRAEFTVLFSLINKFAIYVGLIPTLVRMVILIFIVLMFFMPNITFLILG